MEDEGGGVPSREARSIPASRRSETGGVESGSLHLPRSSKGLMGDPYLTRLAALPRSPKLPASPKGIQPGSLKESPPGMPPAPAPEARAAALARARLHKAGSGALAQIRKRWRGYAPPRTAPEETRPTHPIRGFSTWRRRMPAHSAGAPQPRCGPPQPTAQTPTRRGPPPPTHRRRVLPYPTCRTPQDRRPPPRRRRGRRRCSGGCKACRTGSTSHPMRRRYSTCTVRVAAGASAVPVAPTRSAPATPEATAPSTS